MVNNNSLVTKRLRVDQLPKDLYRVEFVEEEFTFESSGVSVTRTYQKLVNPEALAIKVERWRTQPTDTKSGSWIEALRKLADDKAGAVEIDRKRALRRKDLIVALRGHTLPAHPKEE